MKILMISLAIIACIFAVSYGGGCHTSQLAEKELTEKIRKKIQRNSWMQESADYTGTIPEAGDAEYEMVFIEGGSFTMGSPSNEPNRAPDEGPQYQVNVGSFWMGK